MADEKAHQSPKPEPRIFYGYIVVAAAFIIFMLSFGLQNSFGVFFKPLLTEFGWSRTVTSGAFSVSMMMYGLLSIVMGGLNDRYGPRLVLTLCGIFFGLGYFLMSQTSSAWQLYLFFGVLTGIGLGGVWGPLLSTVARWFVKRRSLMSGVVLSGMGIGSLIAPPVISQLIVVHDWRLSFGILGVVALIFMVAGGQFLRRDPTKMGLVPYGKDEREEPKSASGTYGLSLKEAAGTAQFWLFFIGFFCYGFCLFAIMVHIVPHAIDLGISTATAANILALMGGASIVGNLALGNLGDRIGNRWVYVIGFILMSVSLFWLLVANQAWALFLFAVVFGE